METRTHLFTFPIETDSDRTAVEEALEKLSAELALDHALRLKGGHKAMITVPGVGPEETWSAIDRVVPDWQRVFLPRSAV
jgi:electron transfer flavoprotein alpha/beta subunit